MPGGEVGYLRSSNPNFIHYRVWTGSIWIRTIHCVSFIITFDIPNRWRIYWPTEYFYLSMDLVSSEYPSECRNDIFRRSLIICFQVFPHQSSSSPLSSSSSSSRHTLYYISLKEFLDIRTTNSHERLLETLRSDLGIPGIRKMPARIAATFYGLYRPGFKPWWQQGIFSSPKTVQTGPAPRKPFLQWVTGLFQWIKLPGQCAEHPPPSSPEV